MYVWCNSSPKPLLMPQEPEFEVWSLSRWVGEDADYAHFLLLRTACARGAVQSSSRSKSVSFNSILTWPNDWYFLEHIPTSTIFLTAILGNCVLKFSLFHHKLKTSVHADAEIIVEDVNRWMKTLNEST